MVADVPVDLPDTPFRAFVALDVGEHVRAALASTILRLRRCAPTGVSWVPPENLHVSLAFLGDVSPDVAGLVDLALEDASAATTPFTAEVGGVGWFGPARRPRVVWAGVKGGDTLSELYRRTVRGLEACGLALDDRPFRGHITLGRVKVRNPPGRLLRELVELDAVRFGPIRIEALNLMRSSLSPSGARYDILHSYPLGRGGSTDVAR